MKKWAGYLVLLLFFCTGCRAEVTEEDLSDLHFVKADAVMGEKSPEERALSIKNRLTQIDGIIGTAVVVEGRTAIIGLRLEETVEQSRFSRVKQEVDAAAREVDQYIDNTSITMNSYIVSMIEEMERSRAG